MSDLAGISLIVGAVTGMLCACFVCCPAAAKRCARAFPRSRWAGRVLAAIALVWASILLMQMNLGFLEKYKSLLLIIAPVVFVLVAFFMDELLSPRALGGIMLLVPAPLLLAARWHESAWRYFALVSAYIMVIKGISLVLSPYLFRKWFEMLIKSEKSARIWGAIGLTYSIIWIVLGLTVY